MSNHFYNPSSLLLLLAMLKLFNVCGICLKDRRRTDGRTDDCGPGIWWVLWGGVEQFGGRSGGRGQPCQVSQILRETPAGLCCFKYIGAALLGCLEGDLSQSVSQLWQFPTTVSGNRMKLLGSSRNILLPFLSLSQQPQCHLGKIFKLRVPST